MIVRWIFINIHGDIQDHPARSVISIYYTVAQPCSDWGLFSPRRHCIPQTSDKTWITEEKEGSGCHHSHGKRGCHYPWRQSGYRKWIYCTEFSVPLEGSWTSAQDCDFLPARRKPVLSSYSLFPAFTLSADLSCESLLSLMAFQITPFICGVFLRPKVSLGTLGLEGWGSLVAPISGYGSWPCQIKAQGYITSCTRKPCSVIQTGSLVWQWWHTPTSSQEWKVSLWYDSTTSVMITVTLRRMTRMKM